MYLAKFIGICWVRLEDSVIPAGPGFEQQTQGFHLEVSNTMESLTPELIKNREKRQGKEALPYPSIPLSSSRIYKIAIVTHLNQSLDLKCCMSQWPY